MPPETPAPWLQARQFYNRISRAYDLLADASEHAARTRGLDAVAARPGERVLEIGFGTGHALEALATSVGPDGCVVGVDVSDGMTDLTRRRLAQSDPAARVMLVLGDVRRLPCRDRAFDAVFMCFTLELIDPPEIPGVLAGIAQALVPGGRLGLVSLAARTHHNAVTRVYQWLHRRFPHFVDCQPIDVRRVLEDAGYRLTETADLSIWGLPVLVAVGTRG